MKLSRARKEDISKRDRNVYLGERDHKVEREGEQSHKRSRPVC